MKYHFYALLEQENHTYNVTFPDLPGAITFGDSLEEAIERAKDVLEGHLLVLENEEDDIPSPGEYHTLARNLEVNQQLQLIMVDTHFVRMREENKTENKMVTLPRYLIQLGKENDINFSQTLKRALKDELKL